MALGLSAKPGHLWLASPILTAAILDRSVVRSGAPAWSGSQRIALGMLAAVATLSFYPIVKAYSLGQAQTIVTLLCAALFLCWQHGRTAAGGVMFGLMVLVKPSWAPLVLWAIARGEWRFLIAATATAAAGVVASLSRFDASDYIDFAHVLSYIGARGELFFPNQSANGVLNRLVANGGSLNWDGALFPDPHPIVVIGTSAAAILLLSASLVAVGREWRGSILDLSTMALATTMAAPIAWEHHYGVLMPMYALALPALIRYPVLGRWSVPALAGSYVLVSNFFNIAQKFAGREFLTPVQSYLLFGALVLLILLYMLRRAEYQSSQGYEHPSNSNAPTVRGSTIS